MQQPGAIVVEDVASRPLLPLKLSMKNMATGLRHVTAFSDLALTTLPSRFRS